MAKETFQCRSVCLHVEANDKTTRDFYARSGYRYVAAEPKIVALLNFRPNTSLLLMVKRL